MQLEHEQKNHASLRTTLGSEKSGFNKPNNSQKPQDQKFKRCLTGIPEYVRKSEREREGEREGTREEREREGQSFRTQVVDLRRFRNF